MHFQLNRKWLPKCSTKVIDKRYESSEIFIKSDDEIDENWIVLVYLKIMIPTLTSVEDKSNPSKYVDGISLMKYLNFQTL